MIIDFHCHAGSAEPLTAPWTTDAPLGRYSRRARAARIDHTVIMPTFPGDSAAANREMAELARRDPAHLTGFAWVDPRRDRGRVAALVGQAVALGLRGIKVHGSQATPTREVCQAARRHRLPMLVDVCGKPWTADMFATRYPDVTFIIAHLGSFLDDWRAHQAVIDQLVRLPNVYADTSGVRRFDYLGEAIRRAGPGKILFGSDGPWLHPGLELHKIRLLGLEPRAESLVLGENARRLLGMGAGRGRRIAKPPSIPRYAGATRRPRPDRGRNHPWMPSITRSGSPLAR
jgi:uncharacterized protein